MAGSMVLAARKPFGRSCMNVLRVQPMCMHRTVGLPCTDGVPACAGGHGVEGGPGSKAAGDQALHHARSGRSDRGPHQPVGAPAGPAYPSPTCHPWPMWRRYLDNHGVLQAGSKLNLMGARTPASPTEHLHSAARISNFRYCTRPLRLAEMSCAKMHARAVNEHTANRCQPFIPLATATEGAVFAPLLWFFLRVYSPGVHKQAC